MATLRQDLGPVTAYAYAVSEGYTGTEEEFAEVLANFADSAEQVAADAAQVALDKGAVHDDKEAVDSAEGRVASAVNTFTTTTAPNAVTAVENAGAAQIGLVEAEGTRQIGLVADKGTEQVGTVSSEGTTQIGLVEAKGAEVIASIPGDYSTLQGDIASTYSSSSTYAVGDYVLYSGQLYRCITAISTAEAWTSAKWTAVALGDDVSDLKSALHTTDAQFPFINGAIIPPPFEVGVRWNNNGAEAWSDNQAGLTLKRGTYIELQVGDVVSRNKTVINIYNGAYTTDGTTFNTVASRSDDLVVETAGKYFFNLFKIGGGNFSPEEVLDGWELISFTRAGSIKDKLKELDTAESDIANVKTAIDFEIAPATPDGYYTLPNVGKDLNYLGNLVDNSGTDTSDYISMDGLYDICRIVPNTTKYGMCNIYYYDANKSYIKRDLPGTNYSFSSFNGETVVWFDIDKTTEGLKYIRFVSENNRNFKYWIVENAPQATILDNYAQQSFLNKKIVNFGDSIFGQTRPPKDVSSYLAEKTGATVYNGGFGGCEMGQHADSNFDAFSMYRLAYAVANNDWTLQESAVSASGIPSYFAETVAMLKAIDFSTVDIVTIAYGTNDWFNGSPLDNNGNSNMAYFADALRYSIETLLTAFPNLHIFVCTQTYRFFMDAQGQFTDDSNTRTSSQGTKLTDFVAKTIEVAKQYNLPCINDYNIGMGKYTRSYYFYPTDGTHPKPEGNRLIADNIARNLF